MVAGCSLRHWQKQHAERFDPKLEDSSRPNSATLVHQVLHCSVVPSARAGAANEKLCRSSLSNCFNGACTCRSSTRRKLTGKLLQLWQGDTFRGARPLPPPGRP